MPTTFRMHYKTKHDKTHHNNTFTVNCRRVVIRDFFNQQEKKMMYYQTKIEQSDIFLFPNIFRIQIDLLSKFLFWIQLER